MAGATSNFETIDELFGRIMRSINPLNPHVAEAMAAPVREGIADRAASLSGPGGRWADNVGRYAENKADLGLSVGTGIEEESPRMLDADQLYGEVIEVSDTGFSLAYGTDADAKKRGQWFHNGGGSTDDGTSSAANASQVARPFWVASDQDFEKVGDAIVKLIVDAF